MLLSHVETFSRLETEHLSLLAMAARRERFGPNASIFVEGAPSTAMHLVVDGHVTLERGGVPIAEIATGQDFGTWALFDPEPRLTTARATTDVTVLTIDREAFEQLVEENPDLTHGIFRALARRVRTLAEIVEASHGDRDAQPLWA
jgi:CRP/FNR family transcriptional regulator